MISYFKCYLAGDSKLITDIYVAEHQSQYVRNSRVRTGPLPQSLNHIISNTVNKHSIEIAKRVPTE